MPARIAARPNEKPQVRTRPDLTRERALWRAGARPVAGLDEAGRGPLAGPVVAAAVILDPRRVPDGLDDSKRLGKSQRERLFEFILATAEVAVASISAARIDRVNIRLASLEAMARAAASLPRRPAFALVDGRDLPALPCPGEAVIGGDGLIASVAAASIVAKVTRDRIMARLGLRFPDYGFADHAGYPTTRHLAALRDHGPCPFHRLSFSPLNPAGEAAE